MYFRTKIRIRKHEPGNALFLGNLIMSIKNLDEEQRKSSSGRLADPDSEALLLLFSGVFIPIATCAYQIYHEHRRYQKEDARIIQGHIYTIKRALSKAQIVLDELEKIVKSANLLAEPIWPVGSHGVGFTDEQRDHYVELVNIIVEVFKEIDDACTALLSFSLPDKKSIALEVEITRLQDIISKVNISKTYGEKLRYIRWSISICKNVLIELEKFF
jgi:hypothetical protein